MDEADDGMAEQLVGLLLAATAADERGGGGGEEAAAAVSATAAEAEAEAAWSAREWPHMHLQVSPRRAHSTPALLSTVQTAAAAAAAEVVLVAAVAWPTGAPESLVQVTYLQNPSPPQPPTTPPPPPPPPPPLGERAAEGV